MWGKRIMDIIVSMIGLILLLPLFIFISIVIILESKGGILYRQVRIGKNAVPFKINKFRTMHINADNKGLLTVGDHDTRITQIGYYLRKYKLDELPQLWNVLIGDMSIVGPRPEVEQYVNLYTAEQRKVLNIAPGITDYASLKYFNENELLSHSDDPEYTYIHDIMPDKIKINLEYISKAGINEDIRIIVQTLRRLIL